MKHKEMTLHDIYLPQRSSGLHPEGSPFATIFNFPSCRLLVENKVLKSVLAKGWLEDVEITELGGERDCCDPGVITIMPYSIAFSDVDKNNLDLWYLTESNEPILLG